tara:strand:- start:665 stop:817 length:153 start_codon:yes stop_codon:yes gene_type:complete
MNEALWQKVIENIRQDFKLGDLGALYELLSFVPEKYLLGYLPEDEEEEEA